VRNLLIKFDKFCPSTRALLYVNRALELTPLAEQAERRHLLLLREQIHDVLADRSAQAEDLVLLAALSAPENMHAQAELGLRQANYALAIDDFPRAAAIAADTAALAHTLAWQAGEASARRLHGATLIPLARYDEAHAQLRQALALAQAIGLAGTEDDCLRDLGLIAYHQGDPNTARHYYERTLAIDHAIGDRRGESATLVRLGTVFRALGDHTAALACYEQALRIDRATGDRDDEADGLRGIGLVAYARGDYVHAHQALQESLKLERATGDREGQASCLAALGLVVSTLGEYPTAQEALDQALALSQIIGDRRSEAEVQAHLACLYLLQQAHAVARTHAQSALDLARTLGAQCMEATALTRLGHALCGLHDYLSAVAAYQNAVTLWQELGHALRRLEPLSGLTELALMQGDLATAHTLADELVSVLISGKITWSSELPQIAWRCYQVLCTAADTRASHVLTMACRHLEHQAAQISDTTRRQAFWDDVPVHRLLHTPVTTPNTPGEQPIA